MSCNQGIRELREALGITQEELSSFLGVDRLTIGNWERTSPKLSTEHRKLLHDAGVNTLFVDFREGDYIRDGFNNRQVREAILGGKK